MKTFKSFIQLDEVERVKYKDGIANKMAAVSYLAQTKDPGDLEKVGPEEVGPHDTKKGSGKRPADRLDNKQPFGEAESHQSKTTMKHISNPNAAEKKAAKDIKPGIKGVKDRLDMLRAAKARGALKEDDLAELSTKTLAKAAKSASDPDSDYSYGKSHDPQKFADHAKKTKDAKSAAAVQGAADAKSHYPRSGHTVGSNDTLADRTKSRITATGKANKQDVKTLKGKIQGRNEDVDVELLSDLYDKLDESNQEIFLNQLEEDVEVLLAFAKTIAEE